MCVCGEWGGVAGAAGIWSGRLPSLTYKAHSSLFTAKDHWVHIRHSEELEKLFFSARK